MLWEKGSGFRRRVVGRLCQSPFEDWRLTRLRTQVWGGRQRRPTIFHGVVAGAVILVPASVMPGYSCRVNAFQRDAPK
jgi:hypothetical protein